MSDRQEDVGRRKAKVDEAEADRKSGFDNARKNLAHAFESATSRIRRGGRPVPRSGRQERSGRNPAATLPPQDETGQDRETC